MNKLYSILFSFFVFFSCGKTDHPTTAQPQPSPLHVVDSELYVPEEAKVRRINSPNMEGALKVYGPVDSMYQYYIQNGQKTLRYISYFENGVEIKRRNFITPENYSDIFFDYENEKRYQISPDGEMSNLVFYKNGKLFRKIYPSFLVENISNGLTDSLAYPNGKEGDVFTYNENGRPISMVSRSTNLETQRNFKWENGRIIFYDEKRIREGKTISSKYIKWKRGEDGLTNHITLFDSIHGKERDSPVEYKIEKKENGEAIVSPIVFGRKNNTYIFEKYGNWIKNSYPLSGIEHERIFYYKK